MISSMSLSEICKSKLDQRASGDAKKQQGSNVQNSGRFPSKIPDDMRSASYRLCQLDPRSANCEMD